MSIDPLVAHFQEEQRRANESVKVLSVALHERNARIKELEKQARRLNGYVEALERLVPKDVTRSAWKSAAVATGQ